MSSLIANTFQVPNILVDELIAELTGNELKCYLFIVRKTRGWNKESDTISVSQFCDALKISNRSAIDSCRGLVEKGLIIQKIEYRKSTIFSLSDIKKPCKPDEKTSPVAGEKTSPQEETLVKKLHQHGEKTSPVAGEKTSHTKDTIKPTNINPNTKSIVAPKFDAMKMLLDAGVENQFAIDFLQVRKDAKKSLTQTAFNRIVNEAALAQISTNEAVKICAEKTWLSFNHSWNWQDGVSSGKCAKPSNGLHSGFKERDYTAGINPDGSF